MKKRLALVMAGAAVLLLAMAAPALARVDARAPRRRPHGWLLQLRGPPRRSPSPSYRFQDVEGRNGRHARPSSTTTRPPTTRPTT